MRLMFKLGGIVSVCPCSSVSSVTERGFLGALESGVWVLPQVGSHLPSPPQCPPLPPMSGAGDGAHAAGTLLTLPSAPSHRPRVMVSTV